MIINDDRKQYNMKDIKEAIKVENSLAHEGTEKYIYKMDLPLEKKKKRQGREEGLWLSCLMIFERFEEQTL